MNLKVCFWKLWLTAQDRKWYKIMTLSFIYKVTKTGLSIDEFTVLSAFVKIVQLTVKILGHKVDILM